MQANIRLGAALIPANHWPQRTNATVDERINVVAIAPRTYHDGCRGIG